MTKKAFSELTPRGQQQRIAKYNRELAEKNLQQEFVQVVNSNFRGQSFGPKISEVVRDGVVAGYNVIMRIRRNDYRYIMQDGVKVMLHKDAELPAGAEELPSNQNSVFGNAYAYIPANQEGIVEHYRKVAPKYFYNAIVRTDKKPTDKTGKTIESDVFLYNLFLIKNDKLNPGFEMVGSMNDAQVVDIDEDDMPF